MEVRGEWKSITAGGGIDGANWRNNPQYLLTDISDKQECTIVLKNETKSEKPVGFAVFKKGSPKAQVMDVHTEGELLLVTNAAPKKDQGQSEASYTWYISASELPYTIIPYWVQKKPSKFTLSTTKGKLEPLKMDIAHESVNGSWTEETSGGCLTDESFLLNDQYCLVCTSGGNVTIVLSRAATTTRYKGKIGFYIAQTEGKPTKKSAFEPQDLLHMPTFTSSREVVTSTYLETGTYIIIPCTHEPGHLASYTLLCYTPTHIQLFDPFNESKPLMRLSGEKKKAKKPLNKSKTSVGGTKGLSLSEDGLSTPDGHSPKRSRSVAGRRHKDQVTVDDLEVKNATLIQKLKEELEMEEKRHSRERKKWEDDKKRLQEEIEKSKHTMKKQLDDWQYEKSQIAEKFRIVQEKATDDFGRINELIEQCNDTKTRKNKREEQLFAQINEIKTQILQFEKAEEEEENSISWKNPITFDKKKGKTVQVRGEWKGKSAGGSLNHQSWRFNPMIFLYVDKNSTFTFSLFQPKGDNQHSTNFYVFKTHTPIAKRLIKKYIERDIVCEAAFSNLKPTKATKDTELEASPNPYIIIPATFIPGSESQFSMLIKSNNDFQAQLSDPIKDDWMCVNGEWTTETAGGCTNYPTFVHNPMFSFKLDQPLAMEFHLFQEQEKFDSLGIYILKGDPDQTIKPLAYTSTLNLCHNEFQDKNEAHVSTELQSGNYVVAVSTFSPLKVGPFQLRCLSPKFTGKLVALADPTYIHCKGTWKGKAGGSINDPESWKRNPQFLLVLESEFTLSMILEQTVVGKPFGIGWTIFNTSKKVTECNHTDVAFTSPYKPNKKLVETVKLGAGSYIIVPTTFNSGEETDFQFSLTAPSPRFGTKTASLTSL